MRASKFAGLAVAALLLAVPARRSVAQGVTVNLGRHVSIAAYSPQRFGDWRTDYSYWRPVTVYYVNGVYYMHEVPRAQPVVVYYYRDRYFFAPRDREFAVRHDNGRGHAYGRKARKP